jgi:hypothetical protein
MDLAMIFDWFTNESMDAALQATEWKRREMFLRLAFDVGGRRTECREEASLPETQSPSIEPGDHH